MTDLTQMELFPTTNLAIPRQASTFVFSTGEIADIMDCARERGIHPADLVRQAVLDDLTR